MSQVAASSHMQVTKKLAVAFVACALLLTGLGPSQSASQEASRLVSVIVQALSPDEARSATEALGGTITRDLPIVNGFSARVPEGSLDRLRAVPAVLHVSRDEKVEFNGTFDATKTAHQIPSVTRSKDLWKAGVDGSGTIVALLDTGVYDHPDLGGRVTCGIDLSHEAGTEAECADTFGHGTFMAGLIAGNGSSSGGKWKGSAPGANIVSVKLAGYDGSTDVSHVLAGIQWAVSHKDVYGIDVMSLSLGTDTAMDYRLNPLNFGVERAWQSGITVVVSASNRGPDYSTITSPGDDPYVITVGASSHQGNVNIDDDTVPVFSARGPTASNGLAKPDLVSPGTHTISLRSPGSAIDDMFPGSVVDTNYFKGTGTSMATASVAGQVAQVLQANPGLSPNQVKYRFMETARAISTTDPMAVGRGEVDAYSAATSSLTGEANQNVESSTGLGLLGLTRGSLDVWAETPIGSAQISSELTAQTDPDLIDLTNPLGLISWDATAYVSVEWDATKWSATKWSTEEWTATKWSGATFEATKWSGTKWSGTKWSNSDWDATKWSSTDWDATKWSATKWSSSWYAAAWD